MVKIIDVINYFTLYRHKLLTLKNPSAILLMVIANADYFERNDSLPKDKSANHARIILAAREEFLEKGFEKASMRSISASVGLTSAGLYRHFADKEEMFAKLVQPALDALKSLMETQTIRHYQHLHEGKLEEMWNGDADLLMVEVIYNHYDAFRLLLKSSAGTRFESFFDEFVEASQTETLKYMEALRERGIHVNNIVSEELHLLLNAYYSAFFEVVAHQFSKADALHYLETLKQFFYPGWQAFLGF